MFFLKQIPDDMRLLLTTMKMTAQAGDYLRFVGRSALAQGVGLGILIEQFIRVQFRAVAGQPNQAQAFDIFSDEQLRRCRPMHRVSIDDQVDLAVDLFEHALHELDEHRILESLGLGVCGTAIKCRNNRRTSHEDVTYCRIST